MKRGDHEVTEFISLSAALKAVEPIVRDPTLLRAGREIKQFGRMKPRELLGNVLLALVANPLTAMEWIRVSTDPSPGTFNAIWAGNRTEKTTTGEFVYHLVRLDWVQRYAPRWRLTIAPDFGSWTVVKEQ